MNATDSIIPKPETVSSDSLRGASSITWVMCPFCCFGVHGGFSGRWVLHKPGRVFLIGCHCDCHNGLNRVPGSGDTSETIGGVL